MSERSAMKRWVRGVLRRRWLGPLAATALALVPCAVAGLLFALLVRPKIAGGQVIDLSAMGLMGGSAMDTLVMIAATLGGGLVVISVIDGEDMLFSQNYACPDCNISIEELTPRMFSFNNPYGACPTCTGLGVLMKIDPAIVIPDPSKSLNEGAIQVTGWGSTD